MRSTRHTKHLPTKEVFFQPMMSSQNGWNGLGNFAGITIDADGEYAYINSYIPHDFSALEKIALVMIARATLNPMYMRVFTNYCKNGEAYFEHNDQSLLHASLNTVLDRTQELDISGAVDIRAIEADDYLGIQVSRQAAQAPVHNTNAIITGVRIKYKYR